MIDLFFGLLGMISILIAFFMNQTHRWSTDSLNYDGLNLLGGILLSIYAIMIISIPFLILNLIWMIISFRDVIFGLQKKEKKKTHLHHKKK